MDTAAVPCAGIVVDSYPATRRSLRIAVVTETWPPEVNGVAMTISRIVEGLHRRDHDVQLVRPRPTGGPGRAGGPPIHEVLTRGMPIPFYANARMGMPSKRTLVRLWSLQRPDIVHVATEGPLGWSALQAALHLKLPVSSDFRTNFHSYSEHYRLGLLKRPIAAYLRKFHNRASCTMVPTEALRRDLQREGFQRLVVVARGVDTQRFDPARRSDALRAAWGAGPDDLVVCCVGRLAPEKNLGLLLQAHAAIAAARPASRLVLVGDGPERAALEARCPQAVFAGQQEGEALAAHYASADLFLFPSLTETYGNVVPEAMASGLPLVAFDDAAAGQLVQSGLDGLLVRPDDASGFVQAAVALAADGALRRRLGEAARRRADLQGWDGVVERFEQVLLASLDATTARSWPSVATADRRAA